MRCRTTSAQRLFCFLDPSADPQGACYQLVQALNAVGSGGLFGQGLTAGRQNQLGFLPVQSTDFIFTVVAEELGFIGGMVLLGLFGLLIWRILAIGWGARDSLGMMVAVGLASLLLFQITVNIGMVIGIMPVTGIPLPFITYGGSSMISLLFGHGHPAIGADARPETDLLAADASGCRVSRRRLASRARRVRPRLGSGGWAPPGRDREGRIGRRASCSRRKV